MEQLENEKPKKAVKKKAKRKYKKRTAKKATKKATGKLTAGDETEFKKQLSPEEAKKHTSFHHRGKKKYEVWLKPKHAEWLERAAKIGRGTPETLLDYLVRKAMNEDPTKGYQVGYVDHTFGEKSGFQAKPGVAGAGGTHREDYQFPDLSKL